MHERARKIIQDTIQLLKLDLSGLTVLTEVGSSHFVYTPIIALMAGAKKVYAWSNDSQYGKAADNASYCLDLVRRFQLEEGKIQFYYNGLCEEHLKEADIVTNSFQLRPLDEAKLKWVKSQAVIPVMYEKWELRASDIDVAYCKNKGIKIGGTWENYPGLGVFDFCEQLMLKMILEANYEISGNKIFVWGDDKYGPLLVEGIQKNKGSITGFTTDFNEVVKVAAETDFIFFCDYTDKRNLIGLHGIFDLDLLKSINSSIGLIHLSGNIDAVYAKEKGMMIYPYKNGFDHRMTYTLSHLGLIPLIRLQTAGLKVGEELYNNQISSLTQVV